ncbi:hypothetical protein Scep_019343 [Stephania cephalantha]|uniref:Uncharacterized protein n=1 Tax=Stephania cephalantha TaxID=152367 RepID=A0AAP0IAL4_9MAGN
MAMMNRGDQVTGLSEFMMKKKGSGNDLRIEGDKLVSESGLIETRFQSCLYIV